MTCYFNFGLKFSEVSKSQSKEASSMHGNGKNSLNCISFYCVWSLQQNKFSKMIREQGEKQSDALNMRLIFQNYLNDISKFIF